MLLEKEAVDIMERKEFRNLEQAIKQGRFDETMQGNFLMKASYELVKKKFEEYLSLDLLGHSGKTQRYIAYLCDGRTDVLTYGVLQAIIKKIAQRNNLVKTTTLAGYIIGQLLKISMFREGEKTNPKLMAYLGNEYKRASARRKEELISRHIESLQDGKELMIYSKGTEDIRAGAMLVDLVMKSGADVIEQRKIWKKGIDRYATNYIVLTEAALEGLQGVNYINPTLALYPPMIVPPIPWTGYKTGGYISVELSFIKLKWRKEREYVSRQPLDKPMRAVNKLQEVGWRVNKTIAGIITDVFENNMVDPTSPKTLPRLYGDIPTSIVTEVSDVVDGFGKYPENPTPNEKKAWAIWNRHREGVKIELDGEMGRRLQYLMTMGVVNKMVDFDRFYYVYQLDYRGRVYPVTDFFNPQSKGFVKAMLEFADGHYLDDVGIRWLKIHTANTYGLDKIPFDERVEWASNNRSMLLEVARDPMGNLKDWVGADSPYEFLAACMALQDHVEGRLVHLPIQLDAVNSGIQMYSGLLRDKAGAKSTCVIGDERSDLYAEVAAKIEEKLLAGEYPPIISFTDKTGKERSVSTKIEANSLKGNFTRSMTKKNVMTIPYSVSTRGMSSQNWDTMNDMTLNGKNFWKGDEWIVNKLWTSLTYDSVYEIVKGARAGQEYLKEVARLQKEAAIWHTPLYELPVMQPVPKIEIQRVKTVLGVLSISKIVDGVNRGKQLSSIAANYIHSIDACILMYIADNIGCDLGVIHDCFLVHPNQGENVRQQYKQGYYKVMKADPLAMLAKELDPKGIIPIPYVGDLDLEGVLDSEYIIS